jgi:excisionase family DNA binding protein
LRFWRFAGYACPVANDELLTTSEAAKILRCSRQHIVDLCDQGDLSCIRTGVHRRVLRREVDELAHPSLPREAERSRWLHIVAAGKLATDPQGVLTLAQRNLDRLRRVHDTGRSNRWLDEWQRILDAGPSAVLDVLTSRSPLSVDLRQTSPLMGLLTQEERRAALEAFYASRAADQAAA